MTSFSKVSLNLVGLRPKTFLLVIHHILFISSQHSPWVLCSLIAFLVLLVFFTLEMKRWTLELVVNVNANNPMCWSSNPKPNKLQHCPVSSRLHWITNGLYMKTLLGNTRVVCYLILTQGVRVVWNPNMKFYILLFIHFGSYKARKTNNKRWIFSIYIRVVKSNICCDICNNCLRIQTFRTACISLKGKAVTSFSWDPVHFTVKEFD